MEFDDPRDLTKKCEDCRDRDQMWKERGIRDSSR